MSLQFILGSGLIGYAIGSLIEEERKRAARSLGAEAKVSREDVDKSERKYQDDIRRAKMQAGLKYMRIDLDKNLSDAQKRASKAKVFSEYMATVRNIYRGLKENPSLYEANLDRLCNVLKNLADAKAKAEESPESPSSQVNLAATEGVFRKYAQGLVMRDDIARLLKRCYGDEVPPVTADYIKTFLPDPSTLNLASVPTEAARPMAQPFALQPRRIPVETPSSWRPAETMPQVQETVSQGLQPVATFDDREEVMTPEGAEQACTPPDVWIPGFGCVNALSFAPTPTYGGGGGYPSAPSAPAPVEDRSGWIMTGRLGSSVPGRVRLGPVPLRRTL